MFYQALGGTFVFETILCHLETLPFVISYKVTLLFDFCDTVCVKLYERLPERYQNDGDALWKFNDKSFFFVGGNEVELQYFVLDVRDGTFSHISSCDF